MIQQVTIQTSNAKRLKPLLKSVIANELYDMEHGIKLTRTKLDSL